MLEVVVNL